MLLFSPIPSMQNPISTILYVKGDCKFKSRSLPTKLGFKIFKNQPHCIKIDSAISVNWEILGRKANSCFSWGDLPQNPPRYTSCQNNLRSKDTFGHKEEKHAIRWEIIMPRTITPFQKMSLISSSSEWFWEFTFLGLAVTLQRDAQLRWTQTWRRCAGEVMEADG